MKQVCEKPPFYFHMENGKQNLMYVLNKTKMGLSICHFVFKTVCKFKIVYNLHHASVG